VRQGCKRASSPLTRRLCIEPLEDRSLLSTGRIVGDRNKRPLPASELTLLSASLPSDGLTPAQIAHAYGFDKIQFSDGIRGDGSGQTIAIVEEYDDPKLLNSGDSNFASSDLHMFDLQFGIAEHAGFFTKVWG